MNNIQTPCQLFENTELSFDFGTFEGFNFRDDSAIEASLTGQEVVDWDQDERGEAEFWPSGDNQKVALLFKGKTAVSAADLILLNNLLCELSDDSTASFLRIYYLISVCGEGLAGLTAEKVEDLQASIHEGASFTETRQQAAYELFELYYPQAYQLWEKGMCDGLIFDTDRFLDSPSLSVEEIEVGKTKAIIVVAT